MRALWSDQHRYDLWLRIEILACEAWAEIGRIPASALPKIRDASFDAGRIASLEERVGHDVIAFLTDVNASIGQPEARYVHLGMTSQDLNDTAMAVQLLESSRLIASDLGNVRDAAAELAVRHRKTLMAGRTHGIVAEPITFGFKVAGWVAELDRVRVRLGRATEEAAVGRICGAVGTHATVDPRVEEHVCKALGLRADVVSTQVVARDVHAAFMAIEMTKVLQGLEVRPERMLRNLQFGGGVVFSGRVLTALVESGMSREDAYAIVQKAAMESLQEGGPGFRPQIEKNRAIMERIGARLDEVFDPWAGLENTDLAFERLSLGVKTA